MDTGYLYHHGIKNQRWGYRRWQNEDGSLTPEGRIHYGKGLPRLAKGLKEHSIKSTYKKGARAIDNYNEDTKRLKEAKRNEHEAAGRYVDAKNTQTNLENKLNKAENGIGAKLFGANPRKTRKLQEKINDQKKITDETKREYEDAKYRTLDSEVRNTRLKDIADAYNREGMNKVFKYIDQYGETTLNELLDNDRKFEENYYRVNKV